MKPRVEMLALLRLSRALMALRARWYSRGGRDYAANGFIRCIIGDIIDLKDLYLRYSAERRLILAGMMTVYHAIETLGARQRLERICGHD